MTFESNGPNSKFAYKSPMRFAEARAIRNTVLNDRCFMSYS